MKLFRHLITTICLLIFCNCWQTAKGNNATYTQRQTDYANTALANFSRDAITLQAYKGVPVDTATLNYLLNGLTTSVTPDFDIVQLLRVLLFQDATYHNKILPVLLEVPYWINYGDTTRVFWSENHMSMWMSSDWLLHERYGKPVDPYLRNRLVHYLHLKIQYGYYEFFSSVYNPYCLTGLLNLADFAQDAEIQSLATQAAQQLLRSLLLMTNDKGVFFPPAGRNYSGKYEDPYGQNHNNLIYLLTGMGAVPGGASHAGGFLASSNIAVDTVINSWMPVLDTVIHIGHTIEQGLILNDSMSAVDSVIFGWSAGEYFHPLVAYATFMLITDSGMWKHPDFSAFAPLAIITPPSVVPTAIALNVVSESSTICDDTVAIYKHNSVILASVQDFWPGKRGYQEYPCVASVETTAVYTASGQVIDWALRSADEANDDLPFIKQTKNVALLMYRAEPKPALVGASYPQVSLHWRTADFTEVRQDSLWLLGRLDNNYVGVRRSCEGQINNLYACDIPNGQAWVLMVGDSSTYNSFDHFQQVVDSSQYVEQWYYDTAAQQEVFYAQIIVDGIDINHAWGVDSTLPTGIENIAGTGFKIYPNPANTIVTVDVPNSIQNGTIQVYNAIGQLVYQANLVGTKMVLPVGDLTNGVYAIRLISGDNNMTTKRFVINH